MVCVYIYIYVIKIKPVFPEFKLKCPKGKKYIYDMSGMMSLRAEFVFLDTLNNSFIMNLFISY